MRARDVLRTCVFLSPFAIASLAGACSWDVGKLFDRDDPNVEHARKQYAESLADDSGDIYGARDELEEVLHHHCEADGGKDLVVDRPFASLDLGLVIFRVAELIGRRFGEEEWDAATPQQAEQIAKGRATQLDCAHLLLQRLADDPETSPAMQLKARYLLGNFEFLARHYQKAIDEYDRVLVAHPARGDDPKDAGEPSDDDAVARDAAWNRAIALERLEDQNDAGSDGGDDANEDAPEDSQNDAMNDTADAGGDGNDDGGGDGAPDGGGDGGGEGGSDGSNDSEGDSSGDASNDGAGPGDTGVDSGFDAGGDTQAPSTPPSASSAPPPKAGNDVDLRELDRFSNQAPLDLDLKAKMKERKKLPKAYDK